MDVDTSKWSGEGEFTQLLVDHLQRLPGVAGLRVEDAPASRSEADYNFISNEVYVDFATEVQARARYASGALCRCARRLRPRP